MDQPPRPHNPNPQRVNGRYQDDDDHLVLPVILSSPIGETWVFGEACYAALRPRWPDDFDHFLGFQACWVPSAHEIAVALAVDAVAALPSLFTLAALYV